MDDPCTAQIVLWAGEPPFPDSPAFQIDLGLFYALMGLIYIISGGIVLRRYLQAHPMSAEDGRE